MSWVPWALDRCGGNLLRPSSTGFSFSRTVESSTWHVCNDDEIANAVLNARFGDLVATETGCAPYPVSPRPGG